MPKKRFMPHKKGNGKNKPEPRFSTMEQLNDRVLDLPESERRKHETAKAISDALQYFVNQQNRKATGYMNDFRSRLKEKFEHRIRKKYFGSKSKTQILPQIMKDDKIRKQLKTYEEEIKANDITMKKEFKKKTYEAIKRIFNKEITNHGGSDIDKEAGFYLLRLAKFFKNEKGENVEYKRNSVSHGERGEKGLEYDSGGTRNGLDLVNYEKTMQEGSRKGERYISLFNTLAIVDEHDKSNGARNIAKPTSSTHIIFNLLDELGVLHPKHHDQLRRFVDFVDKADSQHYQFAGADREVSHKTLFGLHRKIRIEKIYEYFEKPGRTGFEVLNDEQLKKLEMQEGSEAQKKENERKEEEHYKIDKEGRYGKFNNERFLFTLGKEFGGGQQITGGITGLFKIFESGDLYMYSPTPLPAKICGFGTNPHFLNIKKVKIDDLKKILDIFEFGKYADPLIKEKFLNYRRDQINKEQEKIDLQKQAEADIKSNIAALKDTEDKSYFKIGEIYDGMINRIENKIAYITLNKGETIKGRIRVEDRNQLKKYAIGSMIKVKVEDTSADKLITLSFASTE